MFQRRRQARKLLRIARMLRELDACSSPARAPRRLAGRAAVSRV